MPSDSSDRSKQLDPADQADQDRVMDLFGKKLRKLRHDKLLTIEQVAEAAGIHPNYLGAVERGERNVTLFNIWRIANGLHLPAMDLMTELPMRKTKRLAARR
jgi:transcriptional regulator with XRE-family HTH domain